MLALIPARGGSKGIPRKNLRVVNGLPLVAHTIRTVRAAGLDPVVSTDSREIAAVAEAHGAKVLARPVYYCSDSTTIAEVAAYHGCCDPIAVFQPTSPTLQPDTIQRALRACEGWPSLESGTWVHDRADPRNRQDANMVWRPSGGIKIARNAHELYERPHRMFKIPFEEAVDVDTLDDLEAARRTLGRRRITFVVTAGSKTGSGHVRRCLTLADELGHHIVRFRFQLERAAWARELIESSGHAMVEDPRWPDEDMIWPDLTVFDCLDTSVEIVAQAKAHGSKVVCLEDLGPGARVADLVFNELYDVDGPRWAVLRPEFVGLPPFVIKERATRLLVTFGGTDPACMTDRVWNALDGFTADIRVVRGPDAPVSMMTEMRAADLVITSAGRTVHECAAVGVPCISIAVNERESRHSHCAGVLRLGLHAGLTDEQLRDAIRRVLDSPGLREEMSTKSRSEVDGLGSRRIAHAIEGLLEGL